jgi:ribosomal-protein-alanine N-acetyltransferase
MQPAGLALHSQRLQLVACTAAMGRAALIEPDSLQPLVGARPADGWPLIEVRRFLPFYIARLERDGSLLGWGVWLVVHLQDGLIIGDVGLHGKPTRDGMAEIGYSIVPAYRGHGYASEAGQAIVEWAFSHRRLQRLIATCEVDNAASAAVLTRLGMRPAGMIEDLLKWELPRQAWAAMHDAATPGQAR